MNIPNVETNTLFESSFIDKERTDKIPEKFIRYFGDLEEEKWMRDIYKIITTSSLVC